MWCPHVWKSHTTCGIVSVLPHTTSHIPHFEKPHTTPHPTFLPHKCGAHMLGNPTLPHHMWYCLSSISYPCIWKLKKFKLMKPTYSRLSSNGKNECSLFRYQHIRIDLSGHVRLRSSDSMLVMVTCK